MPKKIIFPKQNILLKISQSNLMVENLLIQNQEPSTIE